MTLGTGRFNVRIMQRAKGGSFNRVLTVPGLAKPQWASLRTTERDVALDRATEYLKTLIRELSEPAPTPKPSEAPTPTALAPASVNPVLPTVGLALPELWTLFKELARFKRLDPATQYDYERRMPIMIAGLGPDPLASLDGDRLDEYALQREIGGIKYATRPFSRTGRQLPMRTKVAAAVGLRSVQADLKLLRQMISWAARKKTPSGRRLLAEDVMEGYKIPEETSPRRPVATDDRYSRSLAAFTRLAQKEESPQLARLYRMMRVFLIALAGVGRRRSAVLGLRWNDVCLLENDGRMEPRIHFDRTLDKANRAAWLPLEPEVWEALQAWKAEDAGNDDDLIFRGNHDGEPISGRWAAELLDRAEADAGLLPLNRSLFHAYRRRFATARAHREPLHVMRLMGITDAKVFRDCYCHSTTEALVSTLADARPVNDKRLEHAA
ncbi:MAG TPA: site-specific integrase [Gemmatimonadaceae bacterium]